jgi:23S rRNA (guanine745-N1)-methyltransferase
MKIAAATKLACPIDRLPLTLHAVHWRCPNGHSFDVAHEGYCNLLVVQHKSSRDPGDSRAMVQARRAFLEAGHFAPIVEHVLAMLHASLPTTGNAQTSFAVLDAGCGEGYYLDRLSQLASASPSPLALALAGMDVSKWAIKAAARRKVPVTWLVANNRVPPFGPGSIDLIICLFGFPVWEGFTSVQRPGQRVLLVDPAANHLIELRQIIYPAVNTSPPPSLTAALAAGYTLEKEEQLTFSTTLRGAAAIAGLLAMTPHNHRAPLAGRDALSQRAELSVTVDVALRLMVLDPSP